MVKSDTGWGIVPPAVFHFGRLPSHESPEPGDLLKDLYNRRDPEQREPGENAHDHCHHGHEQQDERTVSDPGAQRGFAEHYDATFARPRSRKSSRGFVMAVVTSAINTIIANSVGDSTPISRPTFRITSSISPRVFIKAPSDRASRHDIPVAFAATADPKNFPAIATRITMAQMPQRVLPDISVSVVRSPVKTKKSGNSRTTMTSCR